MSFIGRTWLFVGNWDFFSYLIQDRVEKKKCTKDKGRTERQEREEKRVEKEQKGR